jgi:hypothetical protein
LPLLPIFQLTFTRDAKSRRFSRAHRTYGDPLSGSKGEDEFHFEVEFIEYVLALRGQVQHPVKKTLGKM